MTNAPRKLAKTVQNPFPWPAKDFSIKQGETRLLGLPKFKMGPPPEVIVQTKDVNIAFCFQSEHLNDRSKERYDPAKPPHILMSGFNSEVTPVEVGNFYIFQVCGKNEGTTQILARSSNGTDFAPPVNVTVLSNPKNLVVNTTFQKLWDNHPLQTQNGNIHYPCSGDGHDKDFPENNPPLKNMQCMVRLCWALDKSGVDLSGMNGTACRQKGKEHRRHFSNPYEFPAWGPAVGQSYTWAAHPAAPEPMPGLAAFWFMMGKTGIVLFKNYFTPKGRESMFGGHIDLWNKTTIGNNLHVGNSYENLTAFVRSKSISFWPIS